MNFILFPKMLRRFYEMKRHSKKEYGKDMYNISDHYNKVSKPSFSKSKYSIIPTYYSHKDMKEYSYSDITIVYKKILLNGKLIRENFPKINMKKLTNREY